MRRVVLLGLLIGTGLAVSRASSRGEQESRWTAFDGRDWRGFDPAEKRAYVAGFLASSALADAGRAGVRSPAAVRRMIDSLSRGGGLRFPYSLAVYQTQLDEYYWWENHLPTRLYLALDEINRRLAGHER